MALRHNISEWALDAALRGRVPIQRLPRGPERLTPQFSSSPNWTLESRVADYFAGNRYGARANLVHRLEGELSGKLGFMLHEPHSRNYDSRHVRAYLALWNKANQLGDSELANLSLVWLQHWTLINAAGSILERSNHRDAHGGRKLVVGVTNCLPGQRSKEVFAGEKSSVLFLSEFLDLRNKYKVRHSRNRVRRSKVASFFRTSQGLSFDILSERQKAACRKMMFQGAFPEEGIFSDFVLEVPVRVPLNITRTTTGVKCWFDKRIADKPAVLAMSIERGKDYSYSMRTPEETYTPSGPVLWTLRQDRNGIDVRL